MEVGEAFAATLRLARERANVTQAKLAEHSNLDRTYISLLERGRRQPSLETFLVLSRALKVSPQEFLGSVLEVLDES